MKLDQDALVDLVDDLVDAGADEDRAVASVARWLDEAIDLERIVPAPWGTALEAHDRDAFAVALEWLLGLVKGSPERRAERRAWRKQWRATADELVAGGFKRRAAVRRARRMYPKPWRTK